MRTAFFADLHANREALSACLEHARARQADRSVYLGDLVGYGADPGWVVDTVRAHCDAGAVAVLGNHDAAVWDGSHRPMHPDAERAIAWTRQQLNSRQVDFLASLPLSVEEGERLYVHANAYAPAQWGYLAWLADVKQSIESTNCRFTFCGHVHDPTLFHLTPAGNVATFTPRPETAIPLLQSRRWLAIVGSVGQPRDGNPAACYALFDDDPRELTWFRVPYDVETAAAKIQAAGLPVDLAARLKGSY
jgi:diadenosine tetraphosphatase ApaH/serine/threonine PP2A family protein phosphatase